jgi:hypothetical protein
MSMTMTIPTTDTLASTITSPETPERASPGRRFLDALAQRDFASLEDLLAADVWLRALLPRHLDEHYGSVETAGAFRAWYGAAEAFEALAVDHDTVIGKERIRYRFLLRPDWAPETWHVIEQMAFLSIKDGLIRKIDLVCTGFIDLDESSLPEAAHIATAPPSQVITSPTV